MSTNTSHNLGAGATSVAPMPGERWAKTAPLLSSLWTARPELTARSALLLVVLFVALTQNGALFVATAKTLPTPFTFQEWRIAGSVFITLMNILLLALIPLSFPRLLRPAAIVFVMVGAVCSYFMDTFGVVIDESMIINALRTTAHEAGDLMHGAFWLHIAIFGLVPSLFLLRIRIRPEPAARGAVRRVGWFLLVLVCELALIGLQYNTLTFWGRTHRDVRLYVNPTFPIYSAYRHAKASLFTGKPEPLKVIAADATRAAYPGKKPFVMVMVVGETARAQNFQLNGYHRETNPRLAVIPDLINFSGVSSCGTATAESVPCMFSAMNRGAFSKSKAAGQQNILDILNRLKVSVEWWDNDSGCQGVCQRITTKNLEGAKDPALCEGGECRDGILLRDLGPAMDRASGSSLLVLHMKGSHGPAYFKRYPAAARKFTPDCNDENVQRCSRDEVINAYDNTLVYTDSVLADVIAAMRLRESELDSAVVYVSDHGESLGEKGIYLHGLPYALAPGEQTTVPMVAWFSSGVRSALNLDMACVKAEAQKPASHDNLFHSMLGLFLVSTNIYKPDEDLFTRCRK